MRSKDFPFKHFLNHNLAGGWQNVPQENHLSLILLVIVDPDGNRTILSRALRDANFCPVWYQVTYESTHNMQRYQ